MKVITKLISCALSLTAFSAVASDFTCPSIDDLTKFNGSGYFAFKPSDLDAFSEDEDKMGEEYKDAWFVTKFKISKESVDILMTGVKQQQSEEKYPFDAVNRVLNQLQLAKPYEDKYYQNLNYNLCSYDNNVSFDDADVEEMAFFLHIDLPNAEQFAKMPEEIAKMPALISLVETVAKENR